MSAHPQTQREEIPSQARAELDTINQRLQAADPATDRDVTIALHTYSQA